MRRAGLSFVLAASLLLAGHIPASAVQPETADVLDQGGGAVYAPEGARLVRQANGIAVSVKMPTPEPGSYLYPAGTEPGHPEVFTLWMFVFNRPEHCSDPCGPDDMTNPDVEFGVYNPAGAEVHLAVTSHGGLDPATLPNEFRIPTGSGACGCWWVAIFN